MEHVTESVRMHEYVEPETTPVASRVFDEMVRVRGVSQNMEPILQFLNQNVEIVDLVLLERISAGFYTHPIHVPISNTSDTTPLTGPVALELFVADSVTLEGGTNEDLRLTRSHQDGTVVTVDVPVPQNLEGRFAGEYTRIHHRADRRPDRRFASASIYARNHRRPFRFLCSAFFKSRVRGTCTC